MVCAPLASHTAPYVPLLTELVQRGHRVTCALIEPLHELVTGTGARLVALPVVPVVPASGEPGPPGEVDALHHALEEAIVTLPALLAAFRDDPPDLVLHDTAALAGAVLAARLGAARLQLNVHLVAWDGFEAEAGGMPRTSSSPSTAASAGASRAGSSWPRSASMTTSGCSSVPSGWSNVRRAAWRRSRASCSRTPTA